MALRIIYLFVTGFLAYVTAIDDLQCRITTNLGNHSYNVFNLSDTLILTCSNVGGNRGISVKRWVRDDIDDKNTTSFIYTKSNITRKDAGKYECTLKNRNMTSKPCATFVNINVRPDVNMMSDSSSSHLSVKCFVNAYPKPEIFVYKEWKKLPKHIFDVKNKTEEDQQHYELSIEDIYPDKSENGNYTCIAKNKYGAGNYTIKISNIAEKCPYFLKPGLTNITIHIGETKSLICRVCRKSSSDEPTFNGPRSNKFDIIITNECTADGVQLRTLVLNHTIFNATKNDTGFYVCTYKRDHLISCNDLTKRFYLSVKEPLVSPRQKNVYVAVVVSISGALIGICLLFLVCYLRRKKFALQRLYDSMPELRWDVFVSYSSKDFLWVKDLCESFEQPPFNLIVCLHQRDWELGRTVIDNMADSVYCSHKTLIVLSKHYVESTYCMQELQIAMHNELDSFDKERVVVIKIDGVSLKKLPKALRQKSYLDFSNNEQRKHLKTKLLRALPQKLKMIGETSGENEICGDDSNDCCVGVEGQQTELVVLTR